MHNKVLVIEDVSTKIAAELMANKLEYNQQSKDVDIHAWLLANRESFAGITRIVIPARLGKDDAEFMGLYLGLHLRLTRELKDLRFTPLIFLSESSRDDMLANQIEKNKTKSALLLFTKGSYMTSSFNVGELIDKSLKILDNETLINDVLPNLNIENIKDTGHQIANEWGAFRLAKFAGVELKVPKPASLFFKYKDSFTSNETDPDLKKTVGLFDQSCKALLIDDNADGGWSEVLLHILRNKIISLGKPASLELLKSFEEANAKDHYTEYDVVFLDLRLVKNEGKANHINHIDDFSGTKILKKIKSINNGIQVIIFTASNKVWNIEKLLEIGANGYYIKESPEYVLSDDFSKENYSELIKTIQICLKRKPLKEIYTKSEDIKTILQDLVKQKKLVKSCGNSIQKQVELGYRIVEKANSENDYAMGYLSLFKCLEIINDNYVVWDLATGEWILTISGPLNEYKYNQGIDTYDLITPASFNTGNDSPSTFEKLAGLGFQKLTLSNAEVKSLYFNVLRRNKFVHPDDGGTLTATQQKEVQEIYSYSGYLKLVNSINLIFLRLKDNL